MKTSITIDRERGRKGRRDDRPTNKKSGKNSLESTGLPPSPSEMDEGLQVVVAGGLAAVG
jgi:hypothetical protein